MLLHTHRCVPKKVKVKDKWTESFSYLCPWGIFSGHGNTKESNSEASIPRRIVKKVYSGF